MHHRLLLVALGLLLTTASAARAYIAVSAERLTLPEVILEFKAVAEVTVEKSDPTRGLLKFKVTKELVGKLPAEASLKHSVMAEGKPVPGVGQLRANDTAILFWGSVDNRSLVLTSAGWYLTKTPGSGDDGWERFTQRRDDMNRVFIGSPNELRDAITKLQQGEVATVAHLSAAGGNDKLYAACDMLDPHRRLPAQSFGGKPAADRRELATLLADLKSATPLKRQQAIVALLSRGPNAKAVAPLMQAAADKLPELRALAFEAVAIAAQPADAGNAVDAKVLSALAAGVKDEDRFIAASAARGLAQLGPAAKDALPALAGALPDRNFDFDFRPLRAMEAARAILLIDPASPQADAALQLLTGNKLLNDDRADGYGTRVAGAAALADAGRGASKARDDLARRAKDDKDPHVRVAASEALLRAQATQDTAMALEQLTKSLESEEALLRLRALKAIARIGRPAQSLVGVIGKLSADKNPAIASAARQAAETLR